MKKILIVVLSAIASLGVAFGSSVLANAAGGFELSSWQDLVGKTITFGDTIPESEIQINMNFNSGLAGEEVEYIRLDISERPRVFYLPADGSNQVLVNEEGDWERGANYQVINVYPNQTITATGDLEAFSTMIVGMEDYTPAPAETPTMWQAIITGIGGFLSGMFALISGAFTGVISVFYANNTATIILQALIFAAAAGLVAAAVYVIVRLIKSAVAKLRGGVGAAKGGKKVVEYSISDGKGGFRDVSRKEYRRYNRRRK